MNPDYSEIPEQALAWHQEGLGAAVATVVETWGSAPRKAGAQLAVSGGGQMAGSVSGGCVEGAVVMEAAEAIQDMRPKVLEYGVEDSEAFSHGLACGGVIRVMVEPVGEGGLDPDLLRELARARAGRKPAALATNVKTWERELADRKNPGSLGERLAEAMDMDRSQLMGDWFVNVFNPPLRMLVVGAVHIAQPLLKMARVAGYDTVLIDPRETFGTAERFPGEAIRDEWPDEALRGEGLDSRTAVVTLTHDPKLDDPAISEALKSDAFYIGCLGSRRTHAKRVERLSQAGFKEDLIGRIHAPVGLAIGGSSPAEIAVSIMAQVIQKLRSGGAG